MSVLLPQNGAITVPVPSVVSEAYWEGCRQHRLTYLHCTSCGAVQFNPAVLCRACNARTLEERLSEGRGAVYSWSLVWRGPTPAYTVPYAPAIVALNEGFHMISNIIGCEPDEVTTGLRVEVAFHELFDGTVLPYFTPEKERLDP